MGREFSETHVRACLHAGLKISGRLPAPLLCMQLPDCIEKGH